MKTQIRDQMRDFTTGFAVPFRGVGLLLSKRRLRLLGIVPIFMTAATLILGVAFAFPLLSANLPVFVQSALVFVGMAATGWLTSIFYWLSLILLWPAALFALVYFLFVISRVLATPFYALLAEAVLVETGLIQDRPFRVREWLAISARMLMVSLGKLVIFVVLGATLFLFSFLPGLGLLTAFGFLLMASFDIVDVSLEAMQIGLRDRIRFFRGEFSSFAGLAMVLGLVFLVPGLNFFIFPASIAGGSEIIRRHKAKSGAMMAPGSAGPSAIEQTRG